MNRIHNLVCSSGWWRTRAERELVPWGLNGVQLGGRVLEIGPGFGATTRVLAGKAGQLDVLELDESYCERLRAQFGAQARVTQGSATEMPYGDESFSAVVCFTMLHHIPSAELQDRAFAEIARVLEPGGTFAGTDSVGTGLLFKLIHLRDTLVPLDPDTLPERLRRVGLSDPEVRHVDGTYRFSARKLSAGDQ